MFRKQIVLLTKINPENIEFQLPSTKKDNDKGAKFFNMFYNINGKKTLINIQLPKLIAPFGLSGYTDEKSGVTNYSIPLEIPEDTKAFMILKEIETKALQFVVDNVDFFYKKKIEKENVRAYAKEFIKVDEESKYPANISIKMKFQKDSAENFEARADIITEVPNEEPLVEENQTLNIDSAHQYINKRCEIQSVINAYGYQVDTKYGVSLKAINLRIWTNGDDSNAFLEDSESEDVIDSETEEVIEEPETEEVVETVEPTKKSRKKKSEE